MTDAATMARVIESLAEAYHDDYRARYGGPQWDELDEDVQEANRASARRLFDHARSWGLEITSDPTTDGRPVTLTAEMIEHAAAREHAGWMAQRRAKGWTVGRRDDAARTHPDLIPYDELDEATKAKDRERVAIIPDLVARAGLRLRR